MYTQSFYDVIADAAQNSAAEIVPAVLALTHARSVVDVGCGTGAWLRCFRQNGVMEILGIDGDWARPEALSESEFVAVDLSKPFHLNRTFDLVISLEVAEHLPEASSADFVASLVRLAPMVLFSAAIPGQGGVNHINEQWPEDLGNAFRDARLPRRGLRAGQNMEQRKGSNVVYSQNTMLYVDASVLPSFQALDAIARNTEANRLSIVHPRHYLNKIKTMDHVYYELDPDRFCLSTLLALPLAFY